MDDMFTLRRFELAIMIAGLLLILVFLLPSELFAQREVRSINDSWEFLKGDSEASSQKLVVSSQKLEANAWEKIHLPHTWNVDAYTEKDYYRGKGWYRRQVNLPPHWRGKRILLKMEGASKAAEVYVNGTKAGEHLGGYTAFTLDLTPLLSFDSANILTVCVDNARTDIPPISGDFTFFGGIYRDVWLMAVDGRHLEDKLLVTTPQVSEQQATLSISASVKNETDTKADLELAYTLRQPDGTLLQTKRLPLRLKAGESRTLTHQADVPRPRLWSPESPELYRVEVALCDRRTSEVIDRTDLQTGFRWYSFDADKGFFLNGKPYKLRGICRHQDQKPMGVALTDEQHRRDIRLAKEMGANFVRIAHYPQDDAVLEACDQMGLLVWEEIPVIDIVPDTPAYADNCELSLREMIRQHRNHTSVILWGYMNEILLVTELQYKAEAEWNAAIERTLALANRLERALKEEDPTRLSTMAFHGSQKYNDTGLSEITDVVGWNLYNGWYWGELSGFGEFLAEQHRQYPTHPLMVSEYGAGSDKRLHTLSPRAFDFSSEYQQKYLEHYLPVLENTPYVCGSSHWNLIDFSSALRDESMPRINNKGLLRADRTPKDVYYYFQATWRKDIPVLHIAARDWAKRTIVQRGNSAVLMPVKVYTNLPEVELLIDGHSLGTKTVENHTALFDVPFSEGEPLLEAKAPSIQDALRMQIRTIPTHTADGLKGKELAVNVGSHCYFTSDESQLTWLPDQPYEAGGWGYTGGEVRTTQTQIHRTADNPLFQTQRTGLEAYRFDLPAGVYEVELLFAELSAPQSGTAYQLGQADGGDESSADRFSVSANGVVLEENFSPAEESGHFQALRKKYIVANDTNHIELRFTPVSGTAYLNGIKVWAVH